MIPKCIGDHVELQRGTTYKSALLDLPGPYLLGLGSIARDGGFRQEKLRTYGGPSPNKLLVQPGDMFVSLKDVTQSGDLLGSIARVPLEIAVGRMTQDTVKLSFKTDVYRPYFYWALRTPQYRQHCRSHATGTTNLGLSREDFFAFEIPTLAPEAKKIVDLLEAIEAKIALNRQTNQTLEQIAQAMFKSWFVDFEPTRAKIAAKEAGASLDEIERTAMCAISGKTPAQLAQLPPETQQQLKTTAALFPDALVDSELGEIPAGWAINILADIVEIGSAKRIFAEDYEEAGIPFFRGKEITDLSNGNVTEPEIFISKNKFDEIQKRYGAPKEDDILLTSVGTIGNTYLVRKGDKFYFKDGNLTWIKNYKKTHIPYYLKIWFDIDIGQAAIEEIKIGSTQQAITISAINKIKILMPMHELHITFNTLMQSNFNARNANLVEIKVLNTIRENLLPALLSGKLL